VTADRFADWLRGFLEAAGDKLDAEQVKKIRERLEQVQPRATAAPLEQGDNLGEWMKKFFQQPEPPRDTRFPVVPVMPQPVFPPLSPWDPWGGDLHKITCGGGGAYQ
jgi:hypothetical protein